MGMKTKGFEIVPAELNLPALPVLDGAWVERRLRGGAPSSGPEVRSIDIRGITTRQTSVAEADRLSQPVLRDLHRAMHVGDLSSIGKMLGDRPQLIRDPQACDQLCRWIKNGSLRRHRGRPLDATRWPAPVVAALVDHLISTGAALNRSQAFCRLEPLGLNPDSVKHLYRQAYTEARFRPLLLLDESKARPVEEGDLRWMAGIQALSAGHTVVRNGFDGSLGGVVEMQFRATQ
jgi:hypothetical protein